MESIKTDPKLAKMIMCGDHPSVTKTELNLKEMKAVESRDNNRKTFASYARISPTCSRTERPLELERVRSRPASEHALRALKRLRSTENVARADPPAHKELMQAALASVRWPPYLLAAWLLLLAAAHALHALAAALAAGLPALRFGHISKLCQYFRLLTEETWRNNRTARVRPVLLAIATALLYSLLGALLAIHALVRWAVEPLSAEVDDGASCGQVTRVTDYLEDYDVKTKGEKQ
ncbi:uncharacterized protein LOC123660210 [Melitaea cinxia]|uniref:uncharacterized protein LOC123660210 n=1 Tax=Melitaea cinxia TaxID=113334 RepID=UPI001E273BE1|nr:uncharacterized protein LOC123660210 [Melitaea cinxia]